MEKKESQISLTEGLKFMTSCMNAWILTILATLEADSGDPDFDYYCFDDIQLF